MNRTLKAILYVVLLAAVCGLGFKFHRLYRGLMRADLRPELAEPGETTAPSGSPNTGGTSNAVLATNLPAATNQAGQVTGGTTSNVPPGTNLPAVSTNELASKAPPASNAPPARKHSRTNAPPPAGNQEPAASSLFSLMSYGAVLFLVVVCLSVLLAHDFSTVVAERFCDFMLSDEGEGMKAPEYDRAEQLWLDGQHLEAIQAMREYLKRHPRKLFVAIRIAEIYEKDLGNHLAAALEYEEVLRHRLRPEQWGWAAIHLANLYSGKLNQTAKAVALLRRIDSEYGDTAAAAKARSRLSQLEGEVTEPGAVPAEIAEDPVPPSNLPKGFRPKNR